MKTTSSLCLVGVCSAGLVSWLLWLGEVMTWELRNGLLCRVMEVLCRVTEVKSCVVDCGCLEDGELRKGEGERGNCCQVGFVVVFFRGCRLISGGARYAECGKTGEKAG